MNSRSIFGSFFSGKKRISGHGFSMKKKELSHGLETAYAISLKSRIFHSARYIFEDDGSYVYGNDNASKPKVLRVDGNLDVRLQAFNEWCEVGNYTIINNVIRITPSDSSGSAGSVIGEPVNWVVTIVSNGEMVLQGPNKHS